MNGAQRDFFHSTFHRLDVHITIYIWATAPCINAVTGSYFTNLKTTWKETLKLANKTHCGAKYKMVEQTLQIYL